VPEFPRLRYARNVISMAGAALTTISAVLFLVSAQIKLAAIEIIFLDVDGRTASANAMCAVVVLIVALFLIIMRLTTGSSGLSGMSAAK